MPRLDRRRENPSPANLIGQRVREARAIRGLSQAECASAMQQEVSQTYPEMRYTIDQSDLSRIETGKRPVWDYELRALAVTLGVSCDYLVGLVDELGAILGQGDE